MLSIAVLVLGFLASASASNDLPEFLKPGKCAKVSLQSYFDLSRYAGRWYQTEIIDNPYQPYKKCINSVYEYSAYENGFKVTTAGFDLYNQHHVLQGKISPTDKFPPAHMLVDFPGIFPSPYEVIETDYDSYSCVYACIDWNTYKTEFGFVFSRDPQNYGLATKKCADVFRKNGVDFNQFVTVPHTPDCEYRS